MIAPQTLLQNRYLVLKQIGQGGMGAVYIATDQRFGSTVALKETFFTDATLRKAFEREARLLNRLRHPALPNVSDHFVEDDGQFLVMEYIPGLDLSEMLKEQGGAFPVKEVISWADQLLDALDYLHTQESPVIHRDIKPQNLKLTPRGQIILLDFGLAKGSSLQVSQVTESRSVFGYSRNYAPIEQIKGTGTDPRSDLYGLAATLYHLMTGITPPDALTRAADVLNGRPDPLLPANEVHNQVTPAVAQVLAMALSHNAGQRPQTARAMRTAFGEAAKQTRVSGQITNRQVMNASTIFEQDTQLIGTNRVGAQTPTESKQFGNATVDDDRHATEIDPAAVTAVDKRIASTRIEEPEAEITQIKKASVSARPISRRVVYVVSGFVLLLLVAVVFALTRQPSAPLPNTASPTESNNPSANSATTDQSNPNLNATSEKALPSPSPMPSARLTTKVQPPVAAAQETPERDTRTSPDASTNARNANDETLTAEQIAEERRRANVIERRAAAERIRAQRERRRMEELRRRRTLVRP